MTSMTRPRAVARATHDPVLAARQHELLACYDLLDVLPDVELDAVVRLAATIAGVPNATVNLLDTARQCQLSTHGFAGADVPRDDSICVTTSQLGRVFATTDLSADPVFADHPFVDGRLGRLRLYASVPLVLQGTAIGTLCVFDEQSGELSQAQLDRLADLAAVVVALFERRRQNREATELAAAREAALSALAEAHERLDRSRAFELALLDALPVGVVAAASDGEVILVNRACREWLGEQSGSVVDPVALIARYHLTQADGVTPLEPSEVPLARALQGEALAEGVELVIDPDGLPRRSVRVRAVPVHGAEGQLLGAVSTMADVSAQRTLEEQLRLAALHDPLTGLPNRSLLVDRLEHALVQLPRSGGRLAVLYCDLDGFKQVNDRFGHAAGDAVLRQAAERMVHAVRPGDTVGRIGGDEFVVLCPGVGSMDDAAAIAARIERSLQQPLTSCGDTEHELGISIGIALDVPGSTPETMLTAADDAMYAVKAAHRAGRP